MTESVCIDYQPGRPGSTPIGRDDGGISLKFGRRRDGVDGGRGGSGENLQAFPLAVADLPAQKLVVFVVDFRVERLFPFLHFVDFHRPFVVAEKLLHVESRRSVQLNSTGAAVSGGKRGFGGSAGGRGWRGRAQQ